MSLAMPLQAYLRLKTLNVDFGFIKVQIMCKFLMKKPANNAGFFDFVANLYRIYTMRRLLHPVHTLLQPLKHAEKNNSRSAAQHNENTEEDKQVIDLNSQKGRN